MSQPIPYWAVKDTFIVPASERGQAKLDWFSWFSKHGSPARYGRVRLVDHKLISVVMYRDDQPAGASNFWFTHLDWSEDDWKPIDPKFLRGEVTTAWARLGNILED